MQTHVGVMQHIEAVPNWRKKCFRNCSYLSKSPSLRRGLINLLVNLLKPYPCRRHYISWNLSKFCLRRGGRLYHPGILLGREIFSAFILVRKQSCLLTWRATYLCFPMQFLKHPWKDTLRHVEMPRKIAFACICSVFPTSFTEETIFSPLYILASFVID